MEQACPEARGDQHAPARGKSISPYELAEGHTTYYPQLGVARWNRPGMDWENPMYSHTEEGTEDFEGGS